ncbi:DUF3052 family protein [Actinotignum urinale]|uniref:DUF3052 family protein n=1 Tax=Actinotignum urinale TaxID=190146 RepID=A0AAW9HLW6_9ACTO|nr:DUF3052 family protein [Actinotignum urinale]MDY5129559.1 DUF3052 family protein [Actinotignum urinale]MDY5132219.1 DUF3052 family protein [Actinotignum urinale]MDY5151989.1 DUF3052 family protein [Actinotignum urinale]MDY5154893.1 DUF3052 family protein [Actinotignum urinale]MDY5160852.1 DUF3052 family protein [Actinotignum urinale]
MTLFGFHKGNVIQEFGYDEDVAFDVRDALEDEIGSELADEDYPDVVDGAIAWWRDDDGDADDLADLLLDVKANLDGGQALCWLLIPSMRQQNSVSLSLVEEAAETAGMQPTTSQAISKEWTGVRLTNLGSRR